MSKEKKNISDYEEIQNLIASYSHYADDGDYEMYANNFTVDGELIESGITITPRSKIRELCRRGAELSAVSPGGGKHLQMNSKIDINGDNATAETDLLTIALNLQKGWFIRGSGRYTDQIVREDGRWRFKRREVTWYKNLGVNPLDPEHEKNLIKLFEDVMQDR